MMQAKKIVVMADGARKKEIMDQVLNGPISEDCPASLLRMSERVAYYMDAAAAEGVRNH